MKDWINRNYRTIIISAFLIPIIIVAIVSISHVTTWYETSNPQSWALYLSVGVEIAALGALAAIAAKMGKNAYFPFIIVTLIQFIGNVFYSYYFINVSGDLFTAWVQMTGPVFQFMGVDPSNINAHRGILSLLTGGLLPIISLTFLYSLVRFTEKDTEIVSESEKPLYEDEKIKIKELEDKIEELSKHGVSGHNDFPGSIGVDMSDDKLKTSDIEPVVITASDIIGEVSRVRLKDEELSKIQDLLSNKAPISDKSLIPKEEDSTDDTVILEYPPVTEEDEQIGETLYHDEIPFDEIDNILPTENSIDEDYVSSIDERDYIDDIPDDIDVLSEDDITSVNGVDDEIKKKFNRVPGGNFRKLPGFDLA